MWTDLARQAIGQTIEMVEQITSSQTTIASAVDEQTATTNEMSRSIFQAATGSGEIAASITAVAIDTRRASPARPVRHTAIKLR